MVETDRGRFYAMKYLATKMARMYHGSTVDKIIDAAKADWRGGKDKWNNDVGMIGPWLDAFFGVKSYQIDIHEAGANHIHYLQARITQLKAAASRARGDKFYQQKYGLDPEDAKLLAESYDERIKELSDQINKINKLSK
jgi:hypothetical protein